MTSNVRLTAPTQKDLVEQVCDIVGYAHTQAIRGTVSLRKLGPFAGASITYNMLIRNMLRNAGFGAQTTTRAVLMEVTGVTLLLMLFKQWMGGAKKQKLFEEVLDVAGAMGISKLYLQIKGEFGLPVPPPSP